MAQTIIDNLSKNILKSADKVIAQTKSEKKYLEKIGINEKKIEIIPLFANPDRFTPYNIGKDEFRKKHGLKKFVVLFVGRIDIWQKGLDHLLNALAIVKKKLPVSLVISGDDFGSKKK